MLERRRERLWKREQGSTRDWMGREEWVCVSEVMMERNEGLRPLDSWHTVALERAPPICACSGGALCRGS